MMKIHERFSWAVSVLNLKPADHVLEIGCGAGILAEQIAGKLTTGTVTAIDQSSSMIKLAAKRNQAFLAAGKMNLIVNDFSKAQLPKNSFDKILAFNVNFFWKDPEQELTRIRNYLKLGRPLFVFYQTPGGSVTKIEERIKGKLLHYSFQIVEILYCDRTKPDSAFCIVANPEPVNE